MSVTVIGVLVAITVNRSISWSERSEERKLNIDAETMRMKLIGNQNKAAGS